MQGIYNYTPRTNHVCRVYSVVAVLYSQFVLHVMLFRTWNMFGTYTFVLSDIYICIYTYIYTYIYAVPVFMHSVVSWFRAYPYVARVLSEWFWDGSICPYYYFCFHILHGLNYYYYYKVFLRVYLRIFSATFLITFLFSDIATSINMHVHCSLLRIMILGLLLGTVLSVHTC
jgi:hypothetical protein